MPASAIFSAVVVAAADWMNCPNLVPVLANPQEGNSMAKPSNADRICSDCFDVIIWSPSTNGPRHSYPAPAWLPLARTAGPCLFPCSGLGDVETQRTLSF